MHGCLLANPKMPCWWGSGVWEWVGLVSHGRRRGGGWEQLAHTRSLLLLQCACPAWKPSFLLRPVSSGPISRAWSHCHPQMLPHLGVGMIHGSGNESKLGIHALTLDFHKPFSLYSVSAPTKVTYSHDVMGRPVAFGTHERRALAMRPLPRLL